MFVIEMSWKSITRVIFDTAGQGDRVASVHHTAPASTSTPTSVSTSPGFGLCFVCQFQY